MAPDTPGYITTNNDRNELCAVLGLQASRHPDVLGRSLRLAKEVAALFADAPILSLEEFQRRSAPFGLGAADAQNYYVALRSRTKEQLFAELAELNTLSPQSPKLPTQELASSRNHNRRSHNEDGFVPARGTAADGICPR